MRIDQLKLDPTPETPSSHARRSPIGDKTPDPKSDEASLSDLAATSLGTAKEERIEELRGAVASGSHSVSSSDLATKLIDAHLKP